MKKLLTLLFLLLASQVLATDRYVDQGCTNNITTYVPSTRACTGGLARSYSTIGNGISAMASQDNLYIRQGTYTEDIRDSQFVGKFGASYNSPTLVRAYQSEVVTLNGSIAFNTNTAATFIVFQGDSVAKNFHVLNGMRVGQAGNTNTVSNIKFDGLDVTFNPARYGDAIVALGDAGASSIWFTNMYVHDSTLCASSSPGVQPTHGFYVQAPFTHIENTEIARVTGYGIQNYDQTGGGAHDSTYNNLYIHDAGLLASQPSNCQQTAGGFIVSPAANIIFYNNLVIHNGNGIDINGNNTQVYGNTVYNNTGAFGCCDPAIKIHSNNNTVQNNLVIANFDNSVAVQSGTGNNVTPNQTTGTSALFTNPSGGIFTLTNATSNGASLGPPYNVDKAGNPRGADGNWDMGAYEFGAPTGGGNVTWVNDRGGSGNALGTANWSAAGIPLRPGINNITVTATDNLGNTATDKIQVTYAIPPVSAALVAAYGFETNSGPTAFDSTTNGNNGSLNHPGTPGCGGTAIWANIGKYGHGISLNGIDQCIWVNDSNSLDVTQAFTLSAWVQPSVSNLDYRAVINKNALPANTPYNLFASSTGYCAAGAVAAFSTVNGGVQGQSDTQFICSPQALPIGAWTFVAVVYDGQNLKLFRSDQSTTAFVLQTPQSGYLDNTTGALQIGASEYGEFFQGLLDEVRIYNVALPITGGANVKWGAPCDRATETAIATASLTGDANCSVVPLAAPLNLKVTASGTALKSAANATGIKLGNH